MTEPYQKTGRGGAGNFYSKEDIKPSLQPSDLESQSQRQSQQTEALEELSASNSSQPPTEYLHTGRGGAGNWVKPSELPLNPTLPTTTPESTIPIPAPTPLVKPVFRGGRGGAGNYDWGAVEAEERRREEERKRGEEEGRRVVDGE
ncbi:hypothetical protein LOCC1_G008955, partial [Lachnellula occidentalis]